MNDLGTLPAMFTADIHILSADIITEILSRLPGDSVVRCRHVCKTWRALTYDPSFVDAHTCQLVASSNHKEYNVFPLKVKAQPTTHHHSIPLNFGKWYHNCIGSCNGLVFLGSALPSDEGFFVCNPFTREYINLIRPTQQKEGFMVYGFGYHPCTNEYKVVSIHYKGSSRSPGPGWVSVYTLGSGTWRNIGEIQYQLVLNRRPGLLANGALHWMNKDDNKKIVSFDLADEEFRTVPSPPPPLSPNDVDQLGVLVGCLCVTRSNKTRCESPKEIWVLNHNTNVNMIINPEESWSWNKLEFNIPWKGITSEAESHVVSKGGKVLSWDHNGLVSYDLKTESFHKYELTVNSCEWFDIIPYAKSFVFLKALGEEDVKSFRAAQA